MELKASKYPLPLTPEREAEAIEFIEAAARRELAEGWAISLHPDLPVTIYNYAAACPDDPDGFEPRELTIPLKQFVVGMGTSPEEALEGLDSGGGWHDGEDCAWMCHTDREPRVITIDIEDYQGADKKDEFLRRVIERHMIDKRAASYKA